MSTVHDWLVQRAPDGPRPGEEGPAGPAGPGGQGEPPRNPWWRRRRRGLAVAAAAGALALAATAGSLVAVRPASPVILTTAQIAAKVDPALVDITSTLGYQRGTSAGTGMVLTSSGLVLTNNHVVEGATSIKATDVGNRRTYRAVVVGYDEKRDIAVLRLQGASGLPAVTMGESSAVKVGDRVVALGNADGEGGTPALATGQVTALNQSVRAADAAAGTSEQLTGLIRTDVTVKPGYSGGPLVNSAGQVIGMNTAASASGQAPSGQARTRAYAIPSDRADSVAGQIRAGKPSGTVHIGATAFLGVGLLAGTPVSGAVVARVQEGSPAARAGLAAGDVITSLGGHAIASASDVRDALVPHHPGDTITVGWADRAGQEHTATVKLATGPAG